MTQIPQINDPNHSHPPALVFRLSAKRDCTPRQRRAAFKRLRAWLSMRGILMSRSKDLCIAIAVKGQTYPAMRHQVAHWFIDQTEFDDLRLYQFTSVRELLEGRPFGGVAEALDDLAAGDVAARAHLTVRLQAITRGALLQGLAHLERRNLVFAELCKTPREI